ncbi:adenylate/guanylate cyclase domain-containing protein [Desulforhopalus vacuolatus]|uniref:adenylate/guanylate cyclase domain-containing protein n=1 Tax=Desulforhopalus vacuolatus TaxID=40414 RepID=UPI0019627621|nr:adenylate/guanylate cyclase domain-containing protein [Desulforhopalus vacuolatus]MBM9521039.1 adenylate/guanylate cyclase domain-containing protein [Desulforhopalus vacuolatus]
MKTSSLLQLYCREMGKSGLTNDLLLAHLELLGLIEDAALQKSLLKELIRSYVQLEKRVDGLLKNTLPAKVAEEIKCRGHYAPRSFVCTILFTDFVDFTHLAEKILQEKLINILDEIFTGFDHLVETFQGTKIKTIGDAYMVVFGAPEKVDDNACQAIRAGLKMLEFINNFNRTAPLAFEMRLGIHTGSVMAGVVGHERTQFDVFGDNVNIASRFESSGVPGRINISEETFRLAQSHFTFEKRGLISLKNKKAMEAWLVVDERE